MRISASRFFVALAFVLFVNAALVDAGVLAYPGSAWLVPGGLASWALGQLLP